MFSRREAIKQLGVAGSALAFAPFAAQTRAATASDEDKLPKRFVFVLRANGVLTSEIQPKGLESLVKTRRNGGHSSKGHKVSLATKHMLHPAMNPLADLKQHVNVFQGLSGRMCRASHNASYMLGAFGTTGGTVPPRMATVDGLLAQESGSIFPHLGFTMDNYGALISYPHLSAIDKNKELPYYADPMMAYRDLFGTVIKGNAKAEVNVDRNILDFMIDDVKRYQKRLPGAQKEKLGHYLDGFESLQRRKKRLEGMKATLEKCAPELKDRYTSEIEIERLKAHFEMAGSALIGGLSQVITIRADHMSMRLEGLGLGSKTVHQIGHMIEGQKGGAGGEDFDDGKGEFATRGVILEHHMKLIAELANRLKAVPEGDGTMLDNTVIVYLSDHGDRHHSTFYEWPMITVGNIKGRLTSGHYIQVPGYNSPGHHTIANFYMSLLHAAGHPQDTLGDKDLNMDSHIDQTGPLANWMA